MSDADTPEPAAMAPAERQPAAQPSDHLLTSSEPSEKTARQSRSGAFLGVPIEVTISVGKARPLVSELVELRRDSVLPLDSRVDDPVELYIGDRLIARGELQEIGDSGGRLGVRLTEVADISNEL
jgi:flagellar motor switch protein FliN